MSSSGYEILASRIRVEDVIDRSRFVTTAAPAPTVDAARHFIDEVAAEFSNATHNCFAFAIGPPGSLANVGMSDDGEPHGTAGRPMLDVVIGSGLGDIAVVVTRWFGGTKLGKGGLVRAYGDCVKHALGAGVRVEKIDWNYLTVRLAYDLERNVRHVVERCGAQLLGADFGADVALRIRVPRETREILLTALRDAARGRIEVQTAEG